MDRESLIAQAQREQVELELFREALNLRLLPAPVEVERKPDTGRPIVLMPVRVIPRPYGKDIVYREIINDF
jgi:hypothetical protein